MNLSYTKLRGANVQSRKCTLNAHSIKEKRTQNNNLSFKSNKSETIGGINIGEEMRLKT